MHTHTCTHTRKCVISSKFFWAKTVHLHNRLNKLRPLVRFLSQWVSFERLRLRIEKCRFDFQSKSDLLQRRDGRKNVQTSASASKRRKKNLCWLIQINIFDRGIFDRSPWGAFLLHSVLLCRNRLTWYDPSYLLAACFLRPRPYLIFPHWKCWNYRVCRKINLQQLRFEPTISRSCGHQVTSSSLNFSKDYTKYNL